MEVFPPKVFRLFYRKLTVKVVAVLQARTLLFVETVVGLVKIDGNYLTNPRILHMLERIFDKKNVLWKLDFCHKVKHIEFPHTPYISNSHKALSYFTFGGVHPQAGLSHLFLPCHCALLL